MAEASKKFKEKIEYFLASKEKVAKTLKKSKFCGERLSARTKNLSEFYREEKSIV